MSDYSELPRDQSGEQQPTELLDEELVGEIMEEVDQLIALHGANDNVYLTGSDDLVPLEATGAEKSLIEGTQQVQLPLIESNFETFYADMYTDILSFVGVQFTLKPEQAEDCTQVAFIKAMQALQGGAVIDRPVSWIYRIARNTAIDAIRTDQSRERSAPTISSDAINIQTQPMSTLAESEQDAFAGIDHINYLLSQINPRYAACLILSSQGFTDEEISPIINASVDSVSTIRNRARHAFVAAAVEEGQPDTYMPVMKRIRKKGGALH
jgi:RNA polymerase sigma factor (sigma-70 family)